MHVIPPMIMQQRVLFENVGGKFYTKRFPNCPKLVPLPYSSLKRTGMSAAERFKSSLKMHALAGSSRCICISTPCLRKDIRNATFPAVLPVVSTQKPEDEHFNSYFICKSIIDAGIQCRTQRKSLNSTTFHRRVVRYILVDENLHTY